MAQTSRARTALTALRRHLLTLLAAGVGALVGVGGFTFTYARGGAYLTNDPRACVNCHVMREQFEGWQHGSHRAVAGCNDCHAPPGLLPKLYVKARNGLHHSWAFTTGRFREPIQMGEFNRAVTEEACRGCHATIASAIETHAQGSVRRADARVSCVRCHANVGHLH
ncbi:MAG: cytochrome c nitrite reductase small subunit [Polyangiales bacterium]